MNSVTRQLARAVIPYHISPPSRIAPGIQRTQTDLGHETRRICALLLQLPVASHNWAQMMSDLCTDCGHVVCTPVATANWRQLQMWLSRYISFIQGSAVGSGFAVLWCRGACVLHLHVALLVPASSCGLVLAEQPQTARGRLALHAGRDDAHAAFGHGLYQCKSQNVTGGHDRCPCSHLSGSIFNCPTLSLPHVKAAQLCQRCKRLRCAGWRRTIATKVLVLQPNRKPNE